MTENPRPRNEDELVELIRSIDVPAPQQLHERVAAMTAGRERRRAGAPHASGLRLRLGAAATAVAAVAAALALALSGSGGSTLSLEQASAVALRPATIAAPGESSSDHAQLAAAVDGISFPYWGERFGWRSAGARVDRVAGRTVKTVFYTDGKGRTVGYAIVAGKPAPSVGGSGHVVWRSGTAYRLTSARGVQVVTWKRDGHLCVVAGRGVDSATLLTLASWDDQPRTT